MKNYINADQTSDISRQKRILAFKQNVLLQTIDEIFKRLSQKREPFYFGSINV